MAANKEEVSCLSEVFFSSFQCVLCIESICIIDLKCIV